MNESGINPDEATDSDDKTESKCDNGRKDKDAFSAAAEEPELSFLAEFVLFLGESKAWWMVPILLALCLLALAIWMSSSALAPFIYPLF